MERIILSSYSEDFTTNFKYPIKLDAQKGLTIALKSLTMWVSWHNIDSKFNNNILRYMSNGSNVWAPLIFDNGNYTITELNNYMISFFKTTDDENTPIFFGIDRPTGRFVLKLLNGYKVNFTEGLLHEILGFDANIYEGEVQIATHPGNISKGVDKLQIHCDLVTGARYNDLTSTDILYEFAPTEPPFSQIIIKERDPVFISTSNPSEIRRIRVYITDQNGGIVHLNGTQVSVELLLN